MTNKTSIHWQKITRLQHEVVLKSGNAEEFQTVFFNALNSFVPIDSCVVYLFNGEVGEHIFTQGALNQKIGDRLAKNYLNLFQRDPAWQKLSSTSSDKILWHMDRLSYSSLYQYHFFEKNDLIDKVARLEKTNIGICSCYLYRRLPSPIFSAQDIATLKVCFPFFTALVANHCQMLKLSEQVKSLRYEQKASSLNQSIEDVLNQGVPPFHVLTNRERQVCHRILIGQSIREIAEDLNLSNNSVATYRQRAYQRLSISKVQQLYHLLFDSIRNKRLGNLKTPST